MRRLLAVIGCALSAAVFFPGAAAAQTEQQVVVIGVPGLRWSDVNATDTPSLVELAKSAAVGVLSVRTAAAVDCPADGWLTLSAGNRVRGTGRHTPRCPAAIPAPASLPDQVRANADRASAIITLGGAAKTDEK